MVRMPSRRAVRVTRRAISPRLATSSEPIIRRVLLWITLWMWAGLPVDNPVESALKCGKGRGAEKRGAALPVDLSAEERRRVHEAEGGVREHPRLPVVEIR